MSKPIAFLFCALLSVPAAFAKEDVIFGTSSPLSATVSAGDFEIVTDAELAPETPTRPTTGILFDDAIRNAFKADTAEGRRAARIASDTGVAVMVAYPFVVDAAGFALVGKGDGRLALRMLLVDGATELVSGGVTYLTKKLVGRERPYGPECDKNPKYDPGCGSDDQFASFFSGHTSITFASAGIVCSHAIQLDLYGSQSAEVAACSLSLGAAATIGFLRIVADKHFATDVLTGAVVGAAAGFLLPALLRYQSSSDEREGAAERGLNAPGSTFVPVFSYGGSFQ